MPVAAQRAPLRDGGAGRGLGRCSSPSPTRSRSRSCASRPARHSSTSRRAPGGLVAVVARGDDRVLRTDNHLSLAGSADRVHQERQGWLAHLLHPRARRVAWIGSATGISAGPFVTAPLQELRWSRSRRASPRRRALLRRLQPRRAHGPVHARGARRRAQLRARHRVALRPDRRRSLRAVDRGHRLALHPRALRGGARPPRAGRPVRAVAAAVPAWTRRRSRASSPRSWMHSRARRSSAATSSGASRRRVGRLRRASRRTRTRSRALPPRSPRAASGSLGHGSGRGVRALCGPLSPLRDALAAVPRNTDDEPVVELTSVAGSGSARAPRAPRSPARASFASSRCSANTRHAPATTSSQR